MVIFDDIEEIFQGVRDFNEYSKDLVTLATATGTLFIIIYTIKFAYAAIQGLRLYILSQICCKTDYRAKYGQWACISGSTDGIGLSMAIELAKRGHSIIVIGRNEEKLARTKITLEEEPNVGEVVTVKIDLSESSLENFERVKNLIDPDNRDIGILINNAGIFPDSYQRFCKNDMDFLRTIVNVNVLATLYLTRMIMPGMIERQRGLVLNVSSTIGAISSPYMSVYGPTKTFIDKFSRLLQIEYRSHPIDIINLTPGAVHTKLFKGNSTIAKPSLVNPSPDDYARSCLNAVSTRISSISGTTFHGIGYKVLESIECLGLTPVSLEFFIKMFGKNNCVSPVMKRKKHSDNLRTSNYDTVNDQSQNVAS